MVIMNDDDIINDVEVIIPIPDQGPVTFYYL